MKTTVMAMQAALTLKEVLPAPATLATLEMESAVQVSCCNSLLGRHVIIAHVSETLSINLAILFCSISILET